MGKSRLSLCLAFILFFTSLIPSYAQASLEIKDDLQDVKVEEEKNLVEEVENKDLEKEDVLEEESKNEIASGMDEIQVYNQEDLLKAVEEFNQGDADKKILVKEDINFVIGSSVGDGIINISNLKNNLSIEGEKIVNFKAENIDESKKGRSRFLIYGSSQEILNFKKISSGSLTIKNIDFDGNSSIGGVANYEGKLTIENCNFSNHFIAEKESYKEYDGGSAILNARNMDIRSTEDMIFKNNKSLANGGAIYNTSGQLENTQKSEFDLNKKDIEYNIPKIEMDISKKIVFEENSSQNTGGAVWNDGNIDIEAASIDFVGNTGEMGAGAIFNSILSLRDENIARLDSRTINFNIKSSNTISFKNNKDGGEGGGAIYNGVDQWEENNFIKERNINLSMSAGGNIDFINNSSDGKGGAIFNSGRLKCDEFEAEAGKYKNIVVDKVKSETSIEANNISFMENKSTEDGGAIFNSMGIIEAVSSIEGPTIEKEEASLSVKAMDKVHFYKNKSESNGGAVLNSSVNGAKITTGGNILFEENKSDLKGGAISNSGYESIGNFKFELVSSEGGVEFKSNTAEDRGGAIFNPNQMDIRAKADILFEGNRTYSSGGAIDNDFETSTEFLNFSLPTMKIENAGRISFINNLSEDSGGAVNNSGLMEIIAKNNLLFEKNSSSYNGGAINNDSRDGGKAVYKKNPYKVSLKSLEGEIGFLENGRFSDIDEREFLTSNGGAIFNSGLLDVEAVKDIKLLKNYASENGAALDNSGENEEIKNISSLISEKASVYINENELSEKLDKQDLSVIDGSGEINNPDGGIVNIGGEDAGFICKVVIRSAKDIQLFNNISNTGTVLKIGAMPFYEYEYDENYITTPEEILNLELEAKNGRVYMVGNKTYNNTPVIANTLELSLEAYPDEILNKFEEAKYNNILVDGKPIFTNIYRADSKPGEPDLEVNPIDYPKNSKLVVLLNGYDYFKNDNFKSLYNNITIGGDENRIALEYMVNMNDKLKIRADEIENSTAKLKGSNVFEEEIRLRDGLEYFDEEGLKRSISTVGAVKEGKALVGWKLNKNLETGLDEENLVSNEELFREVIEPMNIVLKELAESNDNSEYTSKIREKFILSDMDILKNFHQFKGGLEITAVWSDELVNIRFDGNGGKFADSTSSKDVEIAKGGKVSRLSEDPARSGYSFKGWSETKDGIKEFDFESTIASDKTLYAIWEKTAVPKINIRFDSNGGKFADSTSSKDVEIAKGGKVSRLSEDPTRSGYSFKGWKLSGSPSYFDFNTILNKSIVLKADWLGSTPVDPPIVVPPAEFIKVTFDANGGNFEDKSIKKMINIGKGSKINRLKEDPKQKGYTFQGWIEDKSEKIFDFDLPVKEDKVLKASWIKNKLNKSDHYQYIYGYKDNTVRPENYITREEVAVVLYRLLDSQYREEIYSDKNIFPDVKAKRWSNIEISTLNNGRVVEGYPDGEFKPGKNISRSEIAAMMVRFYDDGQVDNRNIFTDLSENHWAKKYINIAAAKGWVQGNDGKFRPDESMTRAEFVTMMNNILDRKTKAEDMVDGRKVYKDLDKKKWYYEAMEEAINSHDYRRDTGLEKWIRLVDKSYEDLYGRVKNK